MKRAIAICAVMFAVLFGLTLAPAPADADVVLPKDDAEGYIVDEDPAETESNTGDDTSDGDGTESERNTKGRGSGCSRVLTVKGGNPTTESYLALGAGAFCISVGATVLVFRMARESH